WTIPPVPALSPGGVAIGRPPFDRNAQSQKTPSNLRLEESPSQADHSGRRASTLRIDGDRVQLQPAGSPRSSFSSRVDDQITDTGGPCLQLLTNDSGRSRAGGTRPVTSSASRTRGVTGTSPAASTTTATPSSRTPQFG